MRQRAVALGIVLLLIVVGVAMAAVSRGHRDSDPKSMLLGNARLATQIGDEPAGEARLFAFKSDAAGTARKIRIYVASHNRAKKLVAGVYAYHHGRPGARLTDGTLPRPRPGRWNTVKLRATKIRSGTRYGISVLGGSGRLYFRDNPKRGCHGIGSEQLTTAGLPASWHGGQRRTTCAISAYVVGTVRDISKHEPQANPPRSSPPAGPTPGGSGGAGGGTVTPPTIVGTAGTPALACATTLNPGANVQNALAAAAAGAVVCLNGGDWAQQTIGLQPAAPGVTLAPAPGAIGQVDVAGITFGAPVSNLTVEGLDMTAPIRVYDQASNDTFRWLTMEGWANSQAQLNGAFLIFPGYDGNSSATASVDMEYNQIDDVPQCLQDDSGGGNTFSHNVCGPDIGPGGSDDVHYIQAENVSDETIDNNAILGPPAPGVLSGGSHLNVDHSCGADIEFDNNIVYKPESSGESLLWGDDCATTESHADNNLFVEADTPDTYSMLVGGASGSSGVTFDNNTIVNPTGYGAMTDEISGFAAHNNLVDSSSGYGFTSDCACSDNAGNGGDVTWSPAWQSTSWTPADGSPWSPPPATFYKPAGIASTYGYQGTIGP